MITVAMVGDYDTPALGLSTGSELQTTEGNVHSADRRAYIFNGADAVFGAGDLYAAGEGEGEGCWQG